MSNTQVALGDIVAGLEPDEHVEVTKVTPFGQRTLVEGVGVTTRRVVRRPLGADELARLHKVRGSSHTYDGDPRAFLLGVEAHRIKTAYQFDPLFAVNSSAVDVLPHQVEAVYRYLLPLPRIRFLLADDTGAGKTIMAGLILKELLFRGTVSKVLIVVPGGLTRQWVDEMAEKFGLNFRLINRASFEAEPAQFARSDDGLFVTSIDFIARHDGCLNAARETQWDMVIVDEAHKLSAYEYGIKVDRSERYQAVEALAPRTDHLLFLTATPHRGRKDTFRRLLMLLDEDLFQEDELVTARIGKSAGPVNPQADLPEQKVLTLLVLPPDCVWSEESQLFGGVKDKIKELSEKCGSKDRLYRTTLLFVLPNQRGLTRLRKELREVAALEAVKRDYASQLDPEQLDDLKGKLTRQKETVTEVMGGAFPHLARVEGQDVVVSNMTEIGTNLNDHLLAAWRQVTDEEEWVLRKVGTVTLKKTGMVPTEGGIRVRDAVEAFIRYTDKPLVASSDAVVQGLSQACKDRVVGIGRGVSPEKLQTKKCGEYVALDRSEEGVWVIPSFTEQATEPPVVVGGGGGEAVAATGRTTAVTQEGSGGGGSVTAGTSTGKPPQAIQAMTIAGNVPMESWTDIFRCFVNPAAKLGLKSLLLGIDFRLTAQDGHPLPADHPAVKAMREAANQLGLRIEER